MAVIFATAVLAFGVRPVGATNEGDAPLFENVVVRQGTFDIVLQGDGGNASDIVLNLPGSSTVDTVYLYAMLEGAPSSIDASVDGVRLGATTPYAIDEADGTPRHVHRWDAGSVVTGPGTYSISVDLATGFAYGHALLVVFEAPSVARALVIVNDGNEVLVQRGGPPAQSSTFHGVHDGNDAKLYLGVYGGDPSGPFTGGPNEFLAFRGEDLARGDTTGLPDAPWDGDDGDELDLDVFSVSTVDGDNAVSVGTGNDFIGWFLAALRIPIMDDVPPTIAITSPTSGAEFQQPEIHVTGVAADDIRVARVEVQLNEGTWLVATGTESWSIDLTIAAGTNTIRARAFDQTGNPSIIASVDATMTTTEVVIDPPPTTSPLLIGGIAAAVLFGVAMVLVRSRRRASRCPMCGNDVVRDQETCPSCGASLRATGS